MSTATVEKTKATEAPKEEVPEKPKWEMPKVRVGQFVRFYRYGEKLDSQPPEIAVVVRSGRNVVSRLKTIEGHPLDTVYHIDDPRIKQSADLRANGAWDFTEEDLAQRDLNASLLARVAALEEALKSKK